MKAKLTVTIDENLVPEAKRFARSRGLSLSQLIERSLRDEMAAPAETTFSARWKGRLRPAQRDSERYRRLADKYL